MLDGNIARYSFSLTWRFLLVMALLQVLFLPILAFDLSPEEIENNLSLAMLLPVIQVLSIYGSLYLTLVWLKFSNSKQAGVANKQIQS